jgi:MarR family transcriptional regulator, lower aerobic nicotinate degradation pathway regulator
MDYDLLIDLVQALKNYQLTSTEAAKANLESFSNWLAKTVKKEPVQVEPNPFTTSENEINVEIARLVIGMSRYAKALIKKAIVDYDELIGEDFTYLYSLIDVESLTKTELIEKNVHEKATGLEIIKRLINHQLIEEKQDVTDKRSKRVWLTEKGRQLCFKSFEQLNKVSAIVTGNLLQDEKLTLLHVLQKLRDFHDPIFLHEKDKSLEELLKKVR